MLEVLKVSMHEPWCLITNNMSEFLKEELKKELSSNGKEAEAVARREECDDAVFG